jgi:hydroxyacylglutathione hydrolase
VFLRQFVNEELGNSSYLIGSEATGLAAVIDPQRDVDRYLQVADGLGLRLTHAFDTHLHNDFLSGAHELLAQRGGVWRSGARNAKRSRQHNAPPALPLPRAQN